MRARWRAPALCALALLLALQFAGPAPALAAGGWVVAGKLPAEFTFPRAVLLPDGRVLAISLKNAAVYTMANDGWAAAGALPVDARGAELIVLANGQALLAGGIPNNFNNNPFAPTKQSALFDPATNSWTMGPNMKFGRAEHTMTALANGQVLVVGGEVGGLSPRQPHSTRKEVERYDPATKSWSDAAPLLQARLSHTATRLADGRVLVAGGAVAKTVNSEHAGYDALASTEIYDPATNSWQAAAPLSHPRTGHTATLLLDGTVLVVGATSPERYYPATNTWSSAGTWAAPRWAASAPPCCSGGMSSSWAGKRHRIRKSRPRCSTSRLPIAGTSLPWPPADGRGTRRCWSTGRSWSSVASAM